MRQDEQHEIWPLQREPSQGQVKTPVIRRGYDKTGPPKIFLDK